MTICCTDISRLPGLESIRWRGGVRGGNRIIRWPYIAENDTLSPWVRGGELVFVTGINRPRSEHNLKQLILEGIEHQVAGLVILTGPDFIRQIPGSVVNLANELGLPLFEQPYALKMVVVTETISNAIVQDNLLGQSTKLFLTRLINGFADTPELIQLRASELGLDEHKPYALIAIRLAESRQPSSRDAADSPPADVHQRLQLEQHLNKLLKRRGNAWPVLEHEQDFLILWPTPAPLAAGLADELEQALGFLHTLQPEWQLYAGVSDLQSSLGSLSNAVEQARQAVQFATLHRHQPLFFYERLGIARLFAAIPQRGLLSQFCEQHLGTLCFARDNESVALKNTLTHYLNHFGNQQQAAVSLGIHRNTLRHRLTRIEHLSGHSLGDPYSRLNLQNALLIEQILFQNHSITPSSEP
ncbi:PucR family transcriptional regulator [Salinicola sp. NYA28a]|nr:PucR family transcriptional regulator ligand-binding domain-containing protein [Pseudomonadota bacterium]